MQLIIGLGNPDEKHARTRHNVGFRVLDHLQAEQGFSTFKMETKFRAEVSVGTIGEEKVMLVKPQTYMNLSGEAVRAIIDFYKLSSEQVLVIFDDKDLPFGQLRIRASGGHGGHNGMRSLIQYLGTEAFPRIKVGVANEFTERTPTDQFVLSAFSSEEEVALPDIIHRAVQATQKVVQGGVDEAGTQFNGVEKSLSE